jgi:hypothetical protein
VLGAGGQGRLTLSDRSVRRYLPLDRSYTSSSHAEIMPSCRAVFALDVPEILCLSSLPILVAVV